MDIGVLVVELADLGQSGLRRGDVAARHRIARNPVLLREMGTRGGFLTGLLRGDLVFSEKRGNGGSFRPRLPEQRIALHHIFVVGRGWLVEHEVVQLLEQDWIFGRGTRLSEPRAQEGWCVRSGIPASWTA